MAKSTETLEQNAAGHRAQLGSTLSSLAQAINPDRIGHEVRATTGDLSQSLVSTAMTTARRNPAGLALVALGAAVMALNTNRGTSSERTELDTRGHDARIAAADARMRAKTHIENSPRSGPSSSTLQKWLDAGLDRLGPDARDRVIAARLKAIDAQDKVERQTAKAAQAARDAHDSQPLTSTLAVAGVGALIGALLPSTRTESDLMGAKRDQLMRHADSVLRAELEALNERGEEAVRSGVSAAKDALNSGKAD